jgi:glycosyltransferase involved in cell wall biosynthesis
MKVLMVSSGNNQPIYGVSSFVYEQSEALRNRGIEVDIFPIIGKGVSGYLKASIKLRKLVNKEKYDIIHGHYVMSALVCILQFKVPVIVSFIGTDINNFKNRIIAKSFVLPRTHSIIFVSTKLLSVFGNTKRSSVIPYGLDLEKFFPIEKNKARQYLKWSENTIYVFFASRFDRKEKNAQLAFKAITVLEENGIQCKLIEFKGIKKEDLNFYYNACDLFLMTSKYEGSPQSIKEAIACNCPIVSTDVGDVKEIIGEIEGCYISDQTPEEISKYIELVLKSGKRVESRKTIIDLQLDSNSIAQKIISVYENIIQ